MYWLPQSSHTSHHPSQTPGLPWISYATQKLTLDSCKMVEKQSEAFHTFLWHFFQVWNRILLHIVLVKCPHVQIAFLKFTSCCYILTFWPGQKCHSKVMHRKEVTHSNGSYERKSRGRKLADEMGRTKKFPWYTHRLMHRKRVTCELHDSYFRLMTIKHAISKIKWALNYYIAQSRRNSRQLSSSSREIGRSYRRDVLRKATSGRRGHLRPWWVGVQRRCW